MNREEKEYKVTENAKLDCSSEACYGRFLENPEDEFGFWVDNYPAVTEIHTLLSGFSFCVYTRETCNFSPVGTWKTSLIGIIMHTKTILSTGACLLCKQRDTMNIKEFEQKGEGRYIKF